MLSLAVGIAPSNMGAYNAFIVVNVNRQYYNTRYYNILKGDWKTKYEQENINSKA